MTGKYLEITTTILENKKGLRAVPIYQRLDSSIQVRMQTKLGELKAQRTFWKV